jgi:3'-5' exoribonuclease
MYRKKQPVATLKEGERVEDIFVVKIKKGVSPYQNGYRMNLILSDASGRSIDYTYWGGNEELNVNKISDSIHPDSVVLVRGRVQLFNKKLALSTNPPDTIRVLEKGEYNPDEFIGPPRRDIEKMVEELKGYIASVENPDIRKVLECVFLQNSQFLDTFKIHPAAIEIHHNWKGGLLQHVLEIIEYCKLSKVLFPRLDMDLMVAGALLHDVGKLEEIAVTTRIKGTRDGQLKGHIPMGFHFLSRIMEELKTDTLVRDKLLHMLLSHHGKNEYGSPKEPMFPEAFVLHLADAASSQLTEILDFVSHSKETTEDEFMYHTRHKRNILLR